VSSGQKGELGKWEMGKGESSTDYRNTDSYRNTSNPTLRTAIASSSSSRGRLTGGKTNV
jgi:hypothetical protein